MPPGRVGWPMVAPATFTIAFQCPNCSQQGARRWSEGPGAGRTYLDVSTGFPVEAGRSPKGDPVIVCDACDEIQPD